MHENEQTNYGGALGRTFLIVRSAGPVPSASQCWAAERNKRILPGTGLGCGELGRIRWKLLLYNIMHFFSLPPEIQPRFLAPICELKPSFVLAKLFSLSSQDVSLAEDFTLLIQEKGVSSILQLSGTAGIALQLLLTYLAPLLGLFLELGCCWSLNYRNTTCTEGKKKPQHLVLGVSCHKSGLLLVLTFFPSSSCVDLGVKCGKRSLRIHPQSLGSQDHPTASCFSSL